MNQKFSSGRSLAISKILGLLLSLLLLCGFGGVLVLGIVFPAAAAISTTTAAVNTLFDELPTSINIRPPSQQSVLLAADGNRLATFYTDNRIVVASDGISKAMKDAIVAIEDHRFYQHHGVDPEGLARAVFTNIFGGRRSGGSTLTQQYIKNVLIEAGASNNNQEAVEEATEVSLARKIREARYALALEKQVPKDDILTGYLNIAAFGPNIYGVEAAARHYFSTTAKEITVAQSAVLAGIVQSPVRWDPEHHPDQNQVRRDLVIRRMTEEGMITQAQQDEAKSVPVKDMLKISNTSPGCATAGISSYFCEYVVKYLINNENWAQTPQQRLAILYRGGLTIRTTIDVNKQTAAYNAITSQVPINDASGINIALSSVDPSTGNIVSMVQNTNYGNPTEQDPSATQINLNVDLKHGGGHGFQPGSTFKIFPLTQWIMSGHSIYDKVNATPRNFPGNSWKASCTSGKFDDYSPKNYDLRTRGEWSVLNSVIRSHNVPFLEMVNKMDLCETFSLAEKMGYRPSDPELPTDVLPANILGTGITYPLSMASSVATLANNGKYCEPTPVLSITDPSGKELYHNQNNCQQAVSPAVVAQVDYTLSQVVTNPSGTGYQPRLGRTVAAKTGTTNNAVAAWYVAYTPQLATAIWTGHKNGNVPMENVTVNGRFYKTVFGGTVAGPAFRQYITEALKDVPNLEFPAPTTIITPGPATTPIHPNVNSSPQTNVSPTSTQ